MDRIKSPPSVRQLIGTATHEAVATNLEQKITTQTDLPIDDVLDAYGTSWDKEVTLIEQPEEPLGIAKDAGVGLVKLHHREVAPDLRPVAVEKQAQFTIGGHAYNTWIDLVEKRDDDKIVSELKTGKRTPEGAQHMFQLVGSAIAERQESGEAETGMRLDVLVRTKTPKYHRVSWNAMTPATVGVFRRQIDTANQMVKSGLFPATGLTNGACGWCGYVARCPAYKAAYGNRRP